MTGLKEVEVSTPGTSVTEVSVLEKVGDIQSWFALQYFGTATDTALILLNDSSTQPMEVVRVGQYTVSNSASRVMSAGGTTKYIPFDWGSYSLDAMSTPIANVTDYLSNVATIGTSSLAPMVSTATGGPTITRIILLPGDYIEEVGVLFQVGEELNVLYRFLETVEVS